MAAATISGTAGLSNGGLMANGGGDNPSFLGDSPREMAIDVPSGFSGHPKAQPRLPNNNIVSKPTEGEHSDKIRKYQDEMKKRKEDEARLQRQEDLLRNSLRDSRKLRSLKERSGISANERDRTKGDNSAPRGHSDLYEGEEGVVNSAFDEDEDAFGGRGGKAPLNNGAVSSPAAAVAASWKVSGAGGKELRVDIDGERKGMLGVEQLFALLSALRGKLGSSQSELRSLEQLFNSSKFQDAVRLHNDVQRTAQRHRGHTPSSSIAMAMATGAPPPPVVAIPQSSRPVTQTGRDLAASVYESLPEGGDEGLTAAAAVKLKEILDKPDMQFVLLAHDLLALCEEPQSTHPDDQELYDKVASYGSEEGVGDGANVRVVKLIKHADPLGATVRNEGDSVVIGRIVKGGAAEKSGLLHEGDELLEVNNQALRGKSVNDVADILGALTGPLTFIISSPDHSLPNGGLNNDTARANGGTTRPGEKSTHLIAHFNYNPDDDIYIPCPELGVSFVKGDVLQVIDDSDPHWWQAYREGDTDQPLAGLIPSKTYQEQKEQYQARYQAEAAAQEDYENSSMCCPMGRTAKKKRFSAVAANDLLDADEILTYEEVSQYSPEPDKKRPVIMIGPPDVGRKELRESLMQSDSQRFAAAVPHTSRPRRDDEVDGRDYHFVPRHYFEADIRANKFVEHGQYEKHFYGTSLEAIRQVYTSGKTCLLNLHPQALKILKHSDLKPFVVFIAPPNQEKLRTNAIKAGRSTSSDDLKSIIDKAREMEEKYGHYFNQIIVNSDFDRAYKELLAEINRLESQPQWVPAQWVR